MSKAEKARQIVEEFPHLSKKELGKLLHKRHPLLFFSNEHGRKIVGQVTTWTTGKPGSKHGVFTKTDKHIGPLSIPRGDLNDFSHYKIGGKTIGILCDIHIPYHDFDALGIAIRELQRQNIDTLILNGDILDCYQLSRFNKEPTKMAIKEEIEMVCNFLNDLFLALPKTKIIFKFGNHEERFESFILQKAPELYGFECFELDNLIKIEYTRLFNKPLQVDFVKNKRIIEVGDLDIIHGHEFGASVFSPVNASRGFYLRAKANVIGGHCHQSSEHTESNINGKITGAWSIGCLSDLHPKYLPINKWNTGFAIVRRLEDNGNFEVNNHKIINGKVV